MKTLKQFFITAIIVAIILFPFESSAQTTGCAGGSSPVPEWHRGGNIAGTGAPNIFGTLFPSDINIVTDSKQRMIINSTHATNIINGFTVNTTGYVGIGTPTSLPQWNCGQIGLTGPWTLLHLNGPNTTFTNIGYRPWMQTGAFITEQSEGMYMGIKNEGVFNRADAVINWNDDASGSAGAVNKLRFIFTDAAQGPATSVCTNKIDGRCMDGYEYMRMVPMGGPPAGPSITNSAGFPVGHIGIGPLFTNAAPPQSRLHINAEDNLPTFIQITQGGGGGTGQTANDGFKLGINQNGGAQLIQQENNVMDFITSNGTVLARRMRIAYDGLPTNEPRVGIGSMGNANTYLHLGSGITPFFADVNGYRTWMNVGVLMNSTLRGTNPQPTDTTDNMYVGLRQYGPDQADAIINWGNNPGTNAIADRLRFVFTQFTNQNTRASTHDGLEVMRIQTDGNSGKIGLGGDNFGTAYNPYSANGGVDPGNTVEINSPLVSGNAVVLSANTTNGSTLASPVAGYAPATGWSGLRFTDLRANSIPVPVNTPGTTTNVLSVDVNGDVILVPGGASSLLCSSAGSILPAGPGNNARIGLNNNNFYFEGQGTVANVVNSVAVGIPCGNTLGAKVDVISSNQPIGGRFIIPFGQAPNFGGGGTGVWGEALGNGQSATGGVFIGAGTGQQNIGVRAFASNGSQYNIGIYSTVGGTPSLSLTSGDFAAVLEGDLWGTSNSYGTGYVGYSDAQLKKDTSSFSAGLNVIRNMHPIKYKFNGKARLDTKRNHIGVIAEQLVQIAPYAIDTVYSKLDSSDTEPTALLAVQNDAVVYTAINAIKQLDSTVTAMQSAPTGVSGSGTANYLAKWSGANAVTSSSVFDNGTNVGIGNNNPAVTLDVTGPLGLPATSGTAQTGILRLDPAATAFDFGVSGNAGWIQCANKFNLGSNASLLLNPNGGNIGIGTTSPSSYVQVVVPTPANAGVPSTGISVTNTNTSVAGGTNNGIVSNVSGAFNNYGFYANVSGTSTPGPSSNYGMYSNLTPSSFSGTGNYGVYSNLTSAPGIAGATTYGMYSNAPGSGMVGTTAYGIYSSSFAPPPPFPGFPTGIAYAGYFNGNVAVTGTIGPPSDQKLKDSIQDIANATKLLTQLRPRTFVFKTNDFPSMALPSGKRYGLIAQEMETILPELVSSNTHPAQLDSTGNIVVAAVDYKSANYEGLIPILIKGFNEEHATVDSLKTIIASMQSTLNNCCSVSSKSTNQTTAQLPSSDAELASSNAILYQNMPNPFDGSTIIRYFVPEHSTAVMKFFDEFGNEIKSVELPYKGVKAELNLTTDNLAAGIYSYSLFVNNRMVDTKKMVKSK